MKSRAILSVLLFFLIVCGYPLQTKAVTNAILNPSLEVVDVNSSVLPQYWNTGSWGVNDARFSYPVAGIDGTKAAQVTITSFSSGDAKWYFQDVTVTPGQAYVFQDQYFASVATGLVARYTNAQGVLSYEYLGTPAASDTWQSVSAVFTPPSGTVSVTVFHLLSSVGQLTVDAYSLTSAQTPPPAPGYTQGFISLTFDDGWASQYTNAKPILDAAGYKGTFYVISHVIAGVMPLNGALENDIDANGIPDNWSKVSISGAQFKYPVLGVSGSKAVQMIESSFTSSAPSHWSFGAISIIPDKIYHYHEQYQSTARGTVIAELQLSDGTKQTLVLGNTGVSANWKNFDLDIYIPENAVAVSVYHVLRGNGTLTQDDITFGEPNYISKTQLLGFQSAGHEIGAHTQTHVPLALVPLSVAQNEIIGSRADLLYNGILSVQNLAYPQGSFNASIEQLVQSSGLLSARTVVESYNSKTTDRYALTTQLVTATTTVTQVKNWIDIALANKQWLILTFHQVDNTGAADGTTPATLKAIVNYLQTKNALVKTVSEGLAM